MEKNNWPVGIITVTSTTRYNVIGMALDQREFFSFHFLKVGKINAIQRKNIVKIKLTMGTGVRTMLRVFSSV
jgi:hypothetical protein